jgi:hypothetical protein
LHSQFRSEFATDERGTSLAVHSFVLQTDSIFLVLLLGGIAIGCAGASSRAASDGGGNATAETGSPATCSGGGSCADASSQATSDAAATRAPESSTPGSPSAEAGSLATCDGGGSIVTLASGQTAAGPIAVTATDVYWTSLSGNTVSKVPICGGAVTTLAVNNQGNVSSTVSAGQGSLALDATSIYWGAMAVTNQSQGHPYVVLKVPLTGGTPVTVGTGGGFNGVRVDSTNVYWEADQGGILKESLAGGAPVTIVPDTRIDIFTIDPTNVYVLEGAYSSSAAVVKAPLAGGSPMTLASGGDVRAPTAVAVDETSVYWANYSNSGSISDGGSISNSGSIVKVPIAGGAISTLASGLNYPIGIAVDGFNVYFITEGSAPGGVVTQAGTVMRVPITGGAPTTLWSAPVDPDAGAALIPAGIAVDANNVYWTAQHYPNGSVMQMPK